jgi:hypothetical protein
VSTIINDVDLFFLAATGDQGLSGVDVNVEGSWADSGSNHNAVLNTAEGLQTVLQTIPCEHAIARRSQRTPAEA